MDRTKEPTQVMKEVGGHTLLVTVIFIILFAAAIGLDRLLHWLIAIGIVESGSPTALMILGAKYFLLGVDALFFAAVLLKLTWRSFKEI